MDRRHVFSRLDRAANVSCGTHPLVWFGMGFLLLRATDCPWVKLDVISRRMGRWWLREAAVWLDFREL